MVKVKVHTLEDELCSVQMEVGCTGRQLKEAIEEATNWKELICTQCLALGVNAIHDDEVVDFDGQEDVLVMMTRRPAPGKILHPPCGETEKMQQKALALSMRRFASSPVFVELPMHGIVYGIGQEEVVAIYQAQSEELAQEISEQDAAFEHRTLDSNMFEACLPWDLVAGVKMDDVIAVLALQSNLTIVGDGISSAAAVLLLKNGQLLAMTTEIHEASSVVNFDGMITSATFYADTCEALFDTLPAFAHAMSDPVSQSWLTHAEVRRHELSRPWSIRVQAVDLRGWNVGWWPRGPDRFSPRRDGLGNLPFSQFAPQMPQKFSKALWELREIRRVINHAMHKVQKACCPSEKGRGKRAGCGDDGPETKMPFSEAMSLFHAELATSLNPEVLKENKERPSKLLEPYLTELELSKPPESVDYDFNTQVYVCLRPFETDVVFGLGKTSAVA